MRTDLLSEKDFIYEVYERTGNDTIDSISICFTKEQLKEIMDSKNFEQWYGPLRERVREAYKNLL